MSGCGTTNSQSFFCKTLGFSNKVCLGGQNRGLGVSPRPPARNFEGFLVLFLTLFEVCARVFGFRFGGTPPRRCLTESQAQKYYKRGV